MNQLLVDPIDLHKSRRRGTCEIAKGNLVLQDVPKEISQVNISWLKQCAKAYEISDDINDYILAAVLQFPIGIPNRNGLGFSLQNLASWSWDFGCCYYKTWIAKPTFYEHENKDCTKANGVILDSKLHKDDRGFWKAMVLIGHDRTKYKDLIERVAKKDLTTYSMGALIPRYICSVSGHPIEQSPYLYGSGKLKGRRPNLVEYDGKMQLAFRLGLDPQGFETSLVEEPAWSIADSSDINDPVYL